MVNNTKKRKTVDNVNNKYISILEKFQEARAKQKAVP